MRGPFAVALDDGNGPRHVTRHAQVSGWTKTAFGGDKDANMRLHVRVADWPDLGPDDTLTVYDTRTGGVVWTGGIDLPGRTQSPAGEWLDLQALGTRRLEDVAAPLVYVTRDLTQFKRSRFSVKAAQTQTGELADDTPTIEVSAPEKADVKLTFEGDWVNRMFYRAGINLGRVDIDGKAGGTFADYVCRLRVATGSGGRTTVDSNGATTATFNLAASQGGINTIAAGKDVIFVGVTRDNTTRTATDDDWVAFFNFVARGELYSLAGTPITSGYSANTVTGTEVLTDIIGRGLIPGIDTAKVSLPTLTYAIDQLDFIESATPAAVLDALMVFHPNLTWRLSGDRFTVDVFDESNPRYVLSPSHGGIEQPGDDAGSNVTRVQVAWTDSRGEPRTTWVGTVGRDADPVSLPEGMGSSANAVKFGEAILDEQAKPPRAGSAILRKPVQDLWGGGWVMPHEVEPGHCVIEQTTGDVFRLTEAIYDVANGAARVTFGKPRRTPEQVLARIDKQLRRKGRRRK